MLRWKQKSPRSRRSTRSSVFAIYDCRGYASLSHPGRKRRRLDGLGSRGTRPRDAQQSKAQQAFEASRAGRSGEAPLFRDRANERAAQGGRWQVLYADRVVDCRDVSEAQILARTLLKMGLEVSARLINEPIIVWTAEGRDQMRAWVSK
jgi:hypothetical protein